MRRLTIIEEVIESGVNDLLTAANQVVEIRGALNKSLDPILQDAWIGRGRDAFVNEVSNEFLPDVSELINSILSLSATLKATINDAHLADDTIDRIVDAIADAVDEVTPW